MKKTTFVILSTVIIMLFTMTISTDPAKASDFSMYALEKRFIPTEPYLLHGTDIVTETWPDRDGNINQDWYVTWFRDGKVLREVSYNPNGALRYWAAPHKDGTCGILETTSEAGADERSRLTKITLYDWDDQGLTNPRLIARNSSEIRVAIGGFTVWNREEATIEIFDDYGVLLYTIENAENYPIRLAFDSSGYIWVVTVKYGTNYEDNLYYLRQIKDGSVRWTKELNQVIDIFPDQQNGVYCVSFPGEGSYKPAEIMRLDIEGNKTLMKRLTGNKVVLGCGIYADPDTGDIILKGRAVANSRKVYKVYRMVLDADWNMKELDVRSMNYYNDYNLHVPVNLDGQFFVKANGIDNGNEVLSVLVPFDALQKTDNPGIEVH